MHKQYRFFFNEKKFRTSFLSTWIGIIVVLFKEPHNICSSLRLRCLIKAYRRINDKI